ncbi:MAG: hypothetical protein LGR52_10230, partial [Candidatus Thiosymbion ectosymbiont of Robbea hypermnestra]|nr:hypothetical protein [Candidatus Thiosymbion ectosymbiont of Robbea hypermnestra]
HPWRLDSGNPCRNDGVGVGRLHHLKISHYPALFVSVWTPLPGDNYHGDGQGNGRNDDEPFHLGILQLFDATIGTVVDVPDDDGEHQRDNKTHDDYEWVRRGVALRQPGDQGDIQGETDGKDDLEPSDFFFDTISL